MDVDELYDRIIDSFYEDKSIAEIAKKLGTTRVRVQRVLITEGLWSSNRTRAIAKLREKGKTVSEIAEILGKDEKTIQTFLPYSRGQYGREETADSVNCKDYRDRMKTAASNMHREEKDIVNLVVSDAFSKEAEIVDPERDTSAEFNTDLNNAYRLRFELVHNPDFNYHKNSNLGLDADDEVEFLKLAKAKEGIIREVMVPGKMTLHAMHYMLQVLFGWQNSHLHRFCLSEKMFSFFTNDIYSDWVDLCGSVFRFPGYATEDLCWDDDYREGKSFRSWLKKKYTNYKPGKGVCDNFFYNRLQLEDTREKMLAGDIKKRDMILDANSSLHDLGYYFEGSFNELIESLTVGEIFSNINVNDRASWLSSLTQNQLPEGKKKMDKENKAKLNEIFDGLVKWRVSEATFDFYYYNDKKDVIKEQTNEDPAAVMAYHKRIIKSYERKISKYLWRPQIKPFTKVLYYNYDFGDDWYIKISCEEIIATSEKYVIDVPYCTYIDGMNVVDDVGGINGFFEFLKTINGDDAKEAESNRKWAHSLGWNSRIPHPENLL